MKPSRRFRKKPVVIEAMQFDGTITSAREISAWAKDYGPTFAVSQDDDDFDAEDGWWMTIETLEGSMSVQAGDWVIKGVQDEFYPCKPDIFEATYEEMTYGRDPEDDSGYYSPYG